MQLFATSPQVSSQPPKIKFLMIQLLVIKMDLSSLQIQREMQLQVMLTQIFQQFIFNKRIKWDTLKMFLSIEFVAYVAKYWTKSHKMSEMKFEPLF